MGGLSRRATIIDQEVAKNPNLLVFDAGNFSNANVRIDEQDLLVARRKTQMMLDAFAKSKIDAVGLGERDIHLGLSWLLPEASTRKLPVVLSNVQCDGELQSLFSSQIEIQVGTEKITVYAFVPENTKIPTGTNCSVIGLDAFFAQHPVDSSHVNLAFASLSENEMVSLSDKIDIFIETKVGKAVVHPESLDVDSVWIGVGNKGKTIGHVTTSVKSSVHGFRANDVFANIDEDIEKQQNRIARLQQQRTEAEQEKQEKQVLSLERQISYAEKNITELQSKKSKFADAPPVNNIRHEVIALDSSVPDMPSVLELVTQGKAEIEKLEATETVEAYHGPFVGSAACQSCHVREHAQWSSTPHAQAWQTLVNQKRSLDQECFACHSTGSFHPQGSKSAIQVNETPALLHVGCEACHGSGETHTKTPTSANISKMVPDMVCTQCHDGVRDNGDFDAIEYREKILHNTK